MKVKKKVIFGMVAGLFAVATILNMSLLNDNGAGDVSLDGIAVMAQANPEETEGYAKVTVTKTETYTRLKCEGTGSLECKE